MGYSEDNRIVVTGMGAVTPFGTGVDAFWQALVTGQSAVRETTDERLRQWAPAAAEASLFNPLTVLPRKFVNDSDRFTQMALVAVMEALADAGLDADKQLPLQVGVDAEQVGIAIGSAYGGIQSLDAGAAKLALDPNARVSPRMISKSIPNAAAAAVAMRYGIRGPAMTYSTACASSANAIGEACYWLKAGEVNLVIAGGSECLFAPSILAGLRSAGALAVSGPADVSTWSRPFDRDRQGMVMGEGAAMLVLEPYHQARDRGATIYAELAGYGASNDAYHETSPHPEGAGATVAMRLALQRAGLGIDDVDYINAHATSTPAGDLAEAAALHHLFGEHLNQIPVSSIKGAIGHMLGAAGAIESIASILTIRTGWVPPTLHCDNPDDVAPPHLVPNQAHERQVNTVLSNSFGFGGQNGVLIWRKA